MNNSKQLDFICIGAGKSGTTSLFHYLKEHPQLYIPEEKELPFFDKDKNLDQLHSFLEAYYPAEKNRLWGKITPQYMSTPDIPERLKRHNEELKIIAVLRNPIDRAFSYFQMKEKKRYVKSNFSTTIEDLVNKEDSNDVNFISRGKYYSILSNYYRVFNPDNILLILSEDLKGNRVETLRRIYSFLNVEEFIPANIDKQFYVGGSDFRFKKLHILMYENYITRSIFRFFSKELRVKIRRWYYTEFNTVKKKGEIGQEDRDILKKYYEEDVSSLKNNYFREKDINWKDFS